MIKKLSDQELLAKIQNLVNVERMTLEKILEHLQEIQRRRLYADLGYSSLFKYLVKELGYSEAAAARRIGALKLVNKVPEAKFMIASGELNLTVASQAYQYTKEKNKNDVRKVLDKVRNKTKNEASLEFSKMGLRGTAEKQEYKKPISDKRTRIHVNISNETLKKLEKIKALKKLSTEQAIDYALNLALSKYESSLKKINQSKGTKGRKVPTALKKAVLKRANNQCEFTGCDETRYLEIEHVVPFAKGGKHHLSNLKLYCKTHNQRSAIKEFGLEIMDPFLNPK